jgi:hypothetical protein
VDAYLVIAEKILREARRPLSARDVLKRAYPAGRVPHHLHGRTQHKTLSARVAEDILEHGERSAFFRNAPGRYFLTEFLDDLSIPLEYRQRFIARRRRRQLAQLKPLAFSASDLPGGRASGIVPVRTVLDLLEKGVHHYPRTTKHATPDDIVVWSFVVVAKGSHILTYRHGQYREEREAFRQRRAIGFYAPVLEGDRTLFDHRDYGIVRRGISTITIDLGLTTSVNLATKGEHLATLDCFVRHADEHGVALLSVIRFDAPDWFEPYARRLAINDLRWIELEILSDDLDDLDPWSAAEMAAALRAPSKRAGRGG